ncbi:CDP-alcohol phosphatidyltransferase family protein [Novosphingobium sp. Gsoil 351]|uniref:CDP-alcohol phosphatidyltransferase family protein n=1 Tax=Novosphingobium sp. Gsoil 351 TaxID=2675225 RepID=UPI0012B481F5|nr:CDP-alcohol phosphatidyltransferase family protein [Novosphingobium sp. Gsoil 351]QGN56465.1 CDP-alcohol phosphatidyltransferase [Novosphingobium sp. Gsoil 351]
MRPRELEDTLNHWLYHPLAWQLAKLLARTPLTPNQVSVAGGLTVVCAGIAYTAPLWGGEAWPFSALLGMALHMAWHVIDGADGDLARMTGRTSPYGEMIDGLCDYSSHFVLYLLLGVLLSATLGPWAWAIAIPAGIAHAVQSTHVEAQRRFYLYWVYGKPWLNNALPEGRGPFAWLVSLYLRVAMGTTPSALAIDATITAAAGDPPRLERLRAMIRSEMPPLLRLQRWLGPNSRAIALGLSMLLTAGPLAYFVYGGVWMSLLLIASIVLHNNAWRRLARRIEALG